MRSAAFLIVLLFCATCSLAQSKTFKTLQSRFRDHEDVFHFSASGLFARTAMRFAGEHEFRKAIRDVRSVRFISVPAEAFVKENVTVKGLKKLAVTDSFEELVSVTDHGDEVTVFLKEGKKKKYNRYFVVVDNMEEVLAIELKGFIDADMMRKNSAFTVKHQ
jgi:hypothetical protein